MHARVGLLTSLLVALAPLACGSRTELDVPIQARSRAQLEAGTIRDAESIPDVLEVREATSHPDSIVAVCPDGGSPIAYVLDESAAFYTFDPATLTTTLVGAPQCGDDTGAWDFTVSSAGAAYVIYNDWQIFKVDLTTLACSPTSYANGQLDISGDFTASVVPTTDGREEMVFFAMPGNSSAPILARSDLNAFVLTEIGDIAPAPPSTTYDIKGDALGHLFGLAENGELIEVGPNDAHLELAIATPFTTAGNWALLTLDRQMYFFGGSSVSQYDVASRTLTPLGNVPVEVVGASAVPCLHATSTP